VPRLAHGVMNALIHILTAVVVGAHQVTVKTILFTFYAKDHAIYVDLFCLYCN